MVAEGEVADGTLDGDVYLRGSGDPTFGTKALTRLARRVADTGLDRVAGRVIGDETFFDRRRGGPASGFGISPYVGPLSGLAFNHGSLLPFARGWQTNPPAFAAERMRVSLRREDVAAERRIGTGDAPDDAKTIAAVESPTLAHDRAPHQPTFRQLLRRDAAERLGSAIGRRPDPRPPGQVSRAHTDGKRGFTAQIVDGSGLSRANRVAPRDVGRLLLNAREQPWFDAFYRSLPLAGKSGTLHKRMRGTRASGRCRAKTGTLSGVTALAGYCRAPDGDAMSFALLMNGGNVWAGRRAQDRIASLLASYTGD